MFLTTALIGALCTTAVALNPACAPGGNFDLSIWELQLPTGNPGQPTTISDTSLEGCSGFQDQFFYTDSTDGALVMQVPGSPSSSGCVTTAHSQHCRTELREILPISWDPNGPVNRMTAVLAVIVADESVHGTVIGQVHIDDSLSTKPVAELYYNATGFISMGVEQNRTGGNQILTPVGQVMPGQTFSYEIRYESNVLSVSINSGPFTVLSTYQLDAPLSYFKAGNYNQGNSRSEVHFFSISATHDSSLTKTTTPTNTATNFFPPAIWNQPTPTVGCQGSPPCTLILPPSPLPTPIEITWIFSTATLVSSNGSTYTGLTDITLPPFTISSVSFWPVTIASSMTGSVIFYPSQSVMPPSTVITLPGTETLVPVPSGTYPAFYSPTARPPPSPVPTGTISSCSMWYQSQTNDTCDSIADLYLLTVPDFTSWNPSVMTDCSGLVTGDYYCKWPTFPFFFPRRIANRREQVLLSDLTAPSSRLG
jgi:hypothetical protein